MQGIKGLTISKAKAQLKGEIRRLAEQLPQPCNVCIKAGFRKRKGLTRRDPDNLYVKPIMDGLVHIGLLKDDASKYVAAITLMVDINQEQDSIIITIS
jgi:Holliday junction resolvase RusA-like endonuclease